MHRTDLWFWNKLRNLRQPEKLKQPAFCSSWLTSQQPIRAGTKHHTARHLLFKSSSCLISQICSPLFLPFFSPSLKTRAVCPGFRWNVNFCPVGRSGQTRGPEFGAICCHSPHWFAFWQTLTALVLHGSCFSTNSTPLESQGIELEKHQFSFWCLGTQNDLWSIFPLPGEAFLYLVRSWCSLSFLFCGVQICSWSTQQCVHQSFLCIKVLQILNYNCFET